MKLSFKNKTVLIVGAVRGIGKEITKKFAENEADVWAIDNEKNLLPEILTNVEEKIKKQINCLYCDVTDAKNVNETIKNIEKKSFNNSIDIIVYCAGGTRSRLKTPIENVSDEDWKVIQKVNVEGCFNLTRAVVPGMKKNKMGRIIVISSRAGIGVSLTGIQSYGTAKAAQIGFVKQLSAELGQFGITVNSVAPGFMPTSPDYIKQWKSYGTQRQEEILNSIAMKRIGTPEEIAYAVLFFASEFSSFVTGQTLAVTGSP